MSECVNGSIGFAKETNQRGHKNECQYICCAEDAKCLNAINAKRKGLSRLSRLSRFSGLFGLVWFWLMRQ